ncbi:heavy metal-binding domain-containing protein [Sphingobacterium kitahiroshimense]|uniref:heavy metal-binding domain-containing protein n=1 Tax=Sphingobacterium kitahiroshimense TaxID=470446 RepID=UPI003D36BE03
MQSGSSFVDIFVGRSRNYENKLQELYKSVVESLKQNACSYRADAVIGISVNIDEISGKGTPIVYDHRFRYICITSIPLIEFIC